MRNDELNKEEWDTYWSKKNKKTGAVYDYIAERYRKLIIKNILDHFIQKHFKRGEKLLHAGCGSGQVDVDIQKDFKVTALDISPMALEQYKLANGKDSDVVLGSIFELPFEDNSFDGVYNLGVMEHFDQKDAMIILSEVKRVLKPGGKVLMLWPPTFGLTTNTLDFIHFVLNKILRKNVELHPPEINRIRSKKHALDTLKEAGLEFEDYYFGVKDIFTQVVLVGKKTK